MRLFRLVISKTIFWWRCLSEYLFEISKNFQYSTISSIEIAFLLARSTCSTGGWINRVLFSCFSCFEIHNFYADTYYRIICSYRSRKFFPGKIKNHFLYILKYSSVFIREPQGVRACCNPVPLLVHHNLHDIHQIVLQVRDIPLIEVKRILLFITTRQFQCSSSFSQEPKEQQSAPLTLPALYDPENVLNCPHDTSHQIEQQLITNIHSKQKILLNGSNSNNRQNSW